MSRFFNVILLIAVFFLIGMLFGINKDNTEQQIASSMFQEDLPEEKRFSENSDEIQDISEMSEVNDEDIMETSVPLTITQKTASVIEMGVKGFYEIVVGILYQVAQLFF